MSARTVLITGGAGFIGSHLARHLAEAGDEVVLFDLYAPGPEATWLLQPVMERVQFVQGSVDDPAAVRAVCAGQRVTDVVHTAAIVSFEALQGRPRDALTVNVGGTLTMLEAVREFGLRRLIYFSTIGVLPRVQYEPIDGNHPIILNDDGPGAGFYGASKAAGEAFCFAYRTHFGTDFVIIRPSAVYGLGMRVSNFIKTMVENSVRGEPTRFEHGRDFGRDYTHVADVVQLAKHALDASADVIHDRVFYGATGGALVTAGQVAEMVREIVPGADIEIGGGLTAEDQTKSRFRGRLDIAPAREQLGYAPRYTDVRDGVAEYVSTFRQYCAESGAC